MATAVRIRASSKDLPAATSALTTFFTRGSAGRKSKREANPRARRSSKDKSAWSRSGRSASMAQPAASNLTAAFSTTVRTAGSNGRSPRSADTASRGVRGTGGASVVVGAITEWRRITSSTVRPIGPEVGIRIRSSCSTW